MLTDVQKLAWEWRCSQPLGFFSGVEEGVEEGVLELLVEVMVLQAEAAAPEGGEEKVSKMMREQERPVVVGMGQKETLEAKAKG